MSLATIRSLPEPTRQRLKDELRSGLMSDQDHEAYNKIWRAEHETQLSQALKDQQAMLAKKQDELKRWDEDAKAKARTWFGGDDEVTRKKLQERVDRIAALSKATSLDSFKPADPEKEGRFAYVYAKDESRTIYIDKAFHSAPATGTDSKAGALSHEMSHFRGVGDTTDHVYGPTKAKALAKKDPEAALENADNFEYYLEGAP